MVTVNKIFKISGINLLLLVLFSIVYALYSIIGDYLFYIVFNPNRLSSYDLRQMLLYYIFVYLSVYIWAFLVLILVGNIILELTRKHASITLWCAVFGGLFLLFPVILKLLTGEQYDDIGGYLEKYRSTKYYLVYLLTGLTYGALLFRFIRKQLTLPEPR